MTPSTRLPIVAVIGSGTNPYEDLALPLGSWLATQDVHLLTGAGQGVMAAVSRAFSEVPRRKGLVLGIVPCKAENAPDIPKPGYPNEWVEVPIRTHLHLSGTSGTDLRSRNHIVILTANVLVALPGGPGTASEVKLGLRYRKPLIAFLKDRGEIPELPAGVRWTADLNELKAFVSEQIAAFSG
jgi:uncharacterized protein (TIGR00725 family)